MQLVSISLPKLHLSNNEQHLDISLEGSLQLRFPDGVKPPQTSNDLLKLVTEEHLWIARTGSCYFHLVVSIQGEHVSKRDQIAKLMEWIQYCEVWSKAGVRLQGREGGVTEPLEQMSFSIQHPDLSSALVTPKDAFTAEFQSVTCYVDLTPSKRSLKRKRVEQTDEGIEIQELSGISLHDRGVVDLLTQGWNLTSPQQNVHRDAREVSQSDKIQKVESSEQLRQLFETALEMSIFGSRKQYKGIATYKCSRAECLSQLVPAVFNMQYLKIISDRASLLPVIATSLARMRNAESPSLRYKAGVLAARIVAGNCDYGDRVIRGIEIGAWETLLSSVKIPTRSHHARRDVRRTILNTGTESEPGLCENSVLETQAEERGFADMMEASVNEHSQTESYEARQTLSQQDSSTFFGSQQYSVSEMQVNDCALLPGPHGDHLEAGARYTLDDVPNSESEYGLVMDSTAPHYMMNHDASLLDLQPLVNFNEWLCSGESITEHTRTSAETTMSYGYDDGDVSFYKSFE